MLVQVNSDNHINSSDRLASWVESEVKDSLGRFEPQLTRVEVFLADVNSHKETENDKKCTLEARLAGLAPIAVTKEANSIEEALSAALETLTLTLDSRLGKLHDPKGRVSMGGEQTI
jgi:hypothetical protein